MPLFVEELTKSILESGELAEADGHFDYAASARAVVLAKRVSASTAERCGAERDRRLAPLTRALAGALFDKGCKIEECIS